MIAALELVRVYLQHARHTDDSPDFAIPSFEDFRGTIELLDRRSKSFINQASDLVGRAAPLWSERRTPESRPLRYRYRGRSRWQPWSGCSSAVLYEHEHRLRSCRHSLARSRGRFDLAHGYDSGSIEPLSDSLASNGRARTFAAAGSLRATLAPAKPAQVSHHSCSKFSATNPPGVASASTTKASIGKRFRRWRGTSVVKTISSFCKSDRKRPRFIGARSTPTISLPTAASPTTRSRRPSLIRRARSARQVTKDSSRARRKFTLPPRSKRSARSGPM